MRVLALLLTAALLAGRAAADIYVAPSGSDLNPGTASQPLATVTGAQTVARTRIAAGLPSGGLTVWFSAGNYSLAGGAVFTAADGGTAAAPVVYSALPGQEVHFTGGAQLDPSWFTLVTSSSPVWSRIDPAAQGKVYQVSLAAHGITDYGTLQPRGFSLRAAAPLELSFNGAPMTLARWPNVGQPLAVTGAVASSTQFSYTGNRPSRWSQATGIWMHGLWSADWADFHVPVASIDAGGQAITLAAAPAQYGIAAGQPYYVYNLLEELDTPGEYYVDRSAGILYFWPTAPLAGAQIQASMAAGPLLTVQGAQYLTFRNLIIESARGALVTVASGNHVLFDTCILRNAGEWGVLLAGSQNGVTGCQIRGCGEEGVRLQGGDRLSLTGGGNFVTQSRLHGLGRLAWTYKPAVAFEGGCGNRATHNLIDAHPHAAILLAGNNHQIAANEIWHVCQQTSDAGAIYGGLSWSARGNTITGNYLHDISTALGTHDVNGVYLDDCLSGVSVHGNVFYNIDGTAVFCGGGRDNLIQNNLIAQCGLGHFNDDRGRSRIDNNAGSGWNLLGELGSVGYQSGIWSASYPACAAIPNSWSVLQTGVWLNPQNCVFASNAGWANGTWTFEDNSSGTGVFALYASFANNTASQPALFGAAAALDRSARPASLAAAVAGFQPIAFAAIGPDPVAPVPAASAPAAPTLAAQATGTSSAELGWDDNGGLWSARTATFAVQQQDPASGNWTTLATYGPDVDFAPVAGLGVGSTSIFRVVAQNAAGAAASAAISVTTASGGPVLGAPQQFIAASPLSVVTDMRLNGTVGVSKAQLDSSAGSVRLYDAGDAIAIPFTVPSSGSYQLGVRVRSGGTTGSTSFWPNGYQVQLDGAPLAVTGDPASVSTLDPSYGGCYWGTMNSAPTTLAAGSHTLVVTAEQSWEVADSLSVTPVLAAAAPAPAAPIAPVAAPAPAPAAIPLNASGDVGPVSGAGSTQITAGTVTLTDSGADIWNGVVAFHYAYEELDGDGAITAHVASLTNTDGWAKAGLMIRQSLNAADAYAGVYVTPGNGIAFQWSPAMNTSNGSVQTAGGAPAWLRLVRTGSSFTAYLSADGANWSQIGSTTITMTGPVWIGLVVCSHNPGAVATAVFDSVTAPAAVAAAAPAAPVIAPPAPVAPPPAATPAPSGLLASQADVGSVVGSGTTQISSGVYTLTDSAPDIWNGVVAFRYAYQELDGDGTIEAHVASLTNTDGWAKAGIMIRQSLNAQDAYAAIYATPGNGLAFQWSPGMASANGSVQVGGAAPCWLRLSRSGSTFAAYRSADGVNWTFVGATTVAMTGPVQIGLALCSHNPGAAATGVFDSVRVTGPAANLATDADVGAVAAAGSGAQSGGVFTLTNSGADIWNNTMAFHFTAEALTGDGSITARVGSLTNTGPWAKAGLMIRPSLNAFDAFAGLFVTPGNGIAYQWANSPGATEGSTQVGGAAPQWLRLTRAGNTFTAFVSSDGNGWYQMGSTTIAMPATVYFGLVLCSHSTSGTATATFSSVALPAP